MNRLRFIAPRLLGMVVVAAIVLPACNSTSPVIPGQVTTFTPSNCNGVFGHNTVEVSSSAPNDLWFDPFVAGSNTTLISLSVYAASANPVTFEAGVYSNSVSQPGNLMVETGPQTSGPATQWITASLQHNLNLSMGVTYWLALQSTSFRYVGATTSYAYQSAGAYGTLAANFSGTLSSGYVFSIYGTTCP
jgi:hypothetical protein